MLLQQRIKTLFRRGQPVLTVWEPTPPIRMREGRRYRTDIPYLLPIDFTEYHRLDFEYYALKGVSGEKSYSTPLQAPSSILDVGCGNGRWVTEMAQSFPQALVLGIDIEAFPFSPQPPVSRNIQFIQANILRGLPLPENSFDFVHQRFLGAGIPLKMWPWMIRELLRVTSPRGWLELLEGGDVFLNTGPLMQEMLGWRQAMSRRYDIYPEEIHHLGTWLRGIGAKHVEEQLIRLPLGWSDHHSLILARNFLAICQGLKGQICPHLGVNVTRFEAVTCLLLEEWKTYRTEVLLFSVYGQKG
ncbi:class I SAM-dependent methyltransferase [Ktedonosporobacter rubrisoli]|uniref:Class I SAM-dependent methyltransferase n=1 Tax=Ktedonosporobacter rubrisoli TaxID=2509675 RepID=A0A4P6JM37_KTERU|nr:class I SAM-dependent methyltransferase [Ktedonosporobacter rubrisoli]QBD76294.1 class I SAM-dependent methyltransferase [Ktedonosporobacter rubrisoli]